MTQLSPHFAQDEFEKDAPVPLDCLDLLGRFCSEILEQVRAQFGALQITSGYRTPEVNRQAHGIQNSEHIYTPEYVAADFEPLAAKPREVFDWMRMNPTLPFHQLILEHSSNGSSVVHVSINTTMIGTRSVLEGATHNAEPYTKVDYVPYSPANA